MSSNGHPGATGPLYTVADLQGHFDPVRGAVPVEVLVHYNADHADYAHVFRLAQDVNFVGLLEGSDPQEARRVHHIRLGPNSMTWEQFEALRSRGDFAVFIGKQTLEAVLRFLKQALGRPEGPVGELDRASIRRNFPQITIPISNFCRMDDGRVCNQAVGSFVAEPFANLPA